MKIPNEKDKEWEIRRKNTELWDKWMNMEEGTEKDNAHKEWRKYYDEHIDILGAEKTN